MGVTPSFSTLEILWEKVKYSGKLDSGDKADVCGDKADVCGDTDVLRGDTDEVCGDTDVLRGDTDEVCGDIEVRGGYLRPVEYGETT